VPARAYAHAGDSEKSLGQCREFFRLWKDADPDLLVLNQDNAEYKNLPNNCVASTYLLCPGFEDSDSRRSLKCHSSHKWRNPTGVAASRYQLTLYRPYRTHWVLLGALGLVHCSALQGPQWPNGKVFGHHGQHRPGVGQCQSNRGKK